MVINYITDCTIVKRIKILCILERLVNVLYAIKGVSLIYIIIICSRGDQPDDQL